MEHEYEYNQDAKPGMNQELIGNVTAVLTIIGIACMLLALSKIFE